jgi:hypothetical protein
MSGARVAMVAAVALGVMLLAGWFLTRMDRDGATPGAAPASAELLGAAPATLVPAAVLPEASDLVQVSDAVALPVESERAVAPLAGPAVEGARAHQIWQRLRLLAAASLRSGPDGGEILGVTMDLLALAPIDQPTSAGRAPPAPTLTLLSLPGQGEVRFDPPRQVHVEIEARPGEFTGVTSDGARRARMEFTFDVEDALLTEVKLRVQVDYARSPAFAADLARRGAIVDSRSRVGRYGSTWIPLVLTTSEDPRGLEEWHATPDDSRTMSGAIDANTALDLGRILSASPREQPDTEPMHDLR